ncbi:MAG: GDSL-type esterase/lipase family protein [Candidatus Pacebacteria bacterium]|nr:GDSL-type esterase/lipase family protein [Candidatus Paceibacterota bacterium]
MKIKKSHLFILSSFVIAMALGLATMMTSQQANAGVGSGNNVWVNAANLAPSSRELVMYRNTLNFGTSGYLEKSIDTGKTWISLTGSGSKAWNVFQGAIAASADGQKVWATTCASQCVDYVYFSTDGGTTWASSTVLGPSLSWWKIASSASGNTLILQSMGATMVSTDAGATWKTTLDGVGRGTVAISPDGATMVSLNNPDSDGSINISTNAGTTWSKVTSIPGKAASVAVGANGVMYVGISDTYIYKSTNYGATWTALTSAGMNHWQNLAISDDGVHILALGNVALFYSDSAGANWTQGPGGGMWRLWVAADGSKAYFSGGSAYVPIPLVTSMGATNITSTGATLNASVANDFAFQYSTSVRGFEYGTTNAYGSRVVMNGTFTAGSYSQNISGLTCGTTYFFRPYATNANGTGYGKGGYFTTSLCAGSPGTPSAEPSTLIAPNDTRIFYTPGNVYNGGTYVQVNQTGTSAKFGFTGSFLKMDVDLSLWLEDSVAFSKYPYVNWKIDNGAWQRAQFRPDTGKSTQTVVLASGLADSDHSVQVYYEQGGFEDTWYARSAVNVTGWEVDVGKTISAPTAATGLRSKRMIVLGDSISRGYNAEADSSGVDHTGTGSTFVQDSWAMLVGQALDAEVGIKAYSGAGYRKYGSGPSVTATFDHLDYIHAQPLPYGVDYLIIAEGANDYQTDVTTSVKELLRMARAQVGPNTYIFLMPSFLTLNNINGNPEVTSQIQAGLAAYKATNPSDSRVYFFSIGNIFGAANPYGPMTYTNDAIHPNKPGHALLASKIVEIASQYVSGVTPPVEPPTTTTYTLTYTAGANGNITGSLTQTINSGANGSSVTAVANTGYHFLNWSDGSTANPRTDVSVSSNVSVTAQFEKDVVVVVPDTTAPTPPTNLTAIAPNSSSVKLTWFASVDNVGITGYAILRNGQTIATAPSTSYTDNSVVPGTYSYTVVASDAAGNLSAQSNTVSVTVPQPIVTGPTPVAITSFSVSQKTATTATIKWNTNVPSTGNISYGLTNKATGSVANDTNLSTLHVLTISGLTKSTKYYFKITAVDSVSGTQSTSAVSTFRTQPK